MILEYTDFEMGEMEEQHMVERGVVELRERTMVKGNATAEIAGNSTDGIGMLAGGEGQSAGGQGRGGVGASKGKRQINGACPGKRVHCVCCGEGRLGI